MSNISFSSSENINLLFNTAINKDYLPLKHISKLVNDLTNLLNESNYYVEINVGNDDNVKVFKAHSNILKARSSYFKVALSNNWVKKSESGVILFEKKNIAPKVFEVLLIYIYNGTVNLDNHKENEILDLLEACDELNFDELIEDLQNFLIVEKKEWVQKNLIHIHKMSSMYQSFSLLQGYCKKLIDNSPELFLKSDDIAIMEKSMFISLLERDDLELEEINIWDCVIEWGMRQFGNLNENDISEWNNDDIKELKNILEDVIPLLRIDQITSRNFYKKIKPYMEVISKEIYEEILQYYLCVNQQPRFFLQKGPRTGKRLLNLKIKSLISSWIDGKNELYNSDNLPYDFELKLCGSQDGFTRSVFEENCYNIEQTVVIMKIKNTGELIGGYNPVCWNLKEKSSNERYSIETDKSFIFKIDQNQLNNSILSKVKKPQNAIHHNEKIIEEIFNNIRFNEITIDFYDLDMRNSIDNNNESYCFYIDRNTYENNLNLKNKNVYVQLLEEYEIYKVIKNLG